MTRCLNELKPGRVDVWFADLDRLALGGVRVFEALLSPEEAARAQRFRFPRDLTRYVIQHGLLRSLLARYAESEAANLDIRCKPNGKPYLAGKGNTSLPQFSVSDSDAFAVFALGSFECVGVDIEKIRELPEMMDIVSQHFTPRERHEFLSCPESRRIPLFYRFWTRKEAVLKAQGEGLLRSLDSVDVATQREESGRTKIRIAGSSYSQDFSVVDIEGPPGYAAAMATSGRPADISVHHFPTPRGM